MQSVWRVDADVSAAHRCAIDPEIGTDEIRTLNRAGTTHGSLSEFVFRVRPAAAQAYRDLTGFSDAVGLGVETATGYGLSIVALAQTPCATEPRVGRT